MSRYTVRDHLSNMTKDFANIQAESTLIMSRLTTIEHRLQLTKDGKAAKTKTKVYLAKNLGDIEDSISVIQGVLSSAEGTIKDIVADDL